jgi:hypothetical protein
MKKLKKLFVLVLVAAVVSLGLAGCKNSHEHPTGDHPSSEHPTEETSTEEHPSSEHPAGEHPK